MFVEEFRKKNVQKQDKKRAGRENENKIMWDEWRLGGAGQSKGVPVDGLLCGASMRSTVCKSPVCPVGQELRGDDGGRGWLNAMGGRRVVAGQSGDFQGKPKETG